MFSTSEFTYIFDSVVCVCVCVWYCVSDLLEFDLEKTEPWQVCVIDLGVSPQASKLLWEHERWQQSDT